MECCICLSNITDKQIPFTLSCNHTIHFQCFKKLIFQTKGHIFIKCPLCREMNHSIQKPFLDSYSNIKILCSDSLKTQRCKHTTKRGHRCKRPVSLLNYGYCNLHPTESKVIPKDKYDLLCDYLYYLCLTTNEWRTKINMIDMSKQLVCAFPDKIHKLEDIHYYFNRFFNHNIYTRDDNDYYVNPYAFYTYYNMKPPPTEWVKQCVTNKMII